MTRCAVCLKKIEGKAVAFHDPGRNKELYRHKECPQANYWTKAKAEAEAAKPKSTSPQGMTKPPLEDP